MFVDEPSNLTQLFATGTFCTERTKNQRRLRSVECAMDEILHKLSLRLFFANRCRIDVCARGLIARGQALVSHDLHQFQGGRVARVARVRKHLVDLPHGAGPTFPEHTQDGQLCIRRFRKNSSHEGALYTNQFVYATKTFVMKSPAAEDQDAGALRSRTAR